MTLSDMTCRVAKPRAKPFRLFDGNGLYLEVMPSGAKHWRQKYRLHDKESRISHGQFPEISLAEARNKAVETKTFLRKGIDPVLARLEQQQMASLAQGITFEHVAKEWLSKQTTWTARYAQSVKFRLEKYPLQK